MAKKSAVEKNNRRRQLVDKFKSKRKALKEIVQDRSLEPEERFNATLALAELPRNGSKVRIRNRCMLTGRPRGLLSQVRSVADRVAGLGLGRPDPGRDQGQLVRGSSLMAMSDPLGDMLTRIRNGQMASKMSVKAPGSTSARERARGAPARGLYPRLRGP